MYTIRINIRVNRNTTLSSTYMATLLKSYVLGIPPFTLRTRLPSLSPSYFHPSFLPFPPFFHPIHSLSFLHPSYIHPSFFPAICKSFYLGSTDQPTNQLMDKHCESVKGLLILNSEKLTLTNQPLLV